MSTLMSRPPSRPGQLASLYPKKPVHDMPSYTYVMGEDLGKNFVEQAQHMGVEIHEGEHVTMIARDDEAALVRVTSTKGTYEGRSVIVATGGGGAYDSFFTQSARRYAKPTLRREERGKRVLVIGSGDGRVALLRRWLRSLVCSMMAGHGRRRGLASPSAPCETGTVEIEEQPRGTVVVRNRRRAKAEELISINIGPLDAKIVRQWGLEEPDQVDPIMKTNITGLLLRRHRDPESTSCDRAAAKGLPRETAYIHDSRRNSRWVSSRRRGGGDAARLKSIAKAALPAADRELLEPERRRAELGPELEVPSHRIDPHQHVGDLPRHRDPFYRLADLTLVDPVPLDLLRVFPRRQIEPESRRARHE
jgi:2-polyprenyl-6-methoxyphenol hydroxylase-like FAD-dependent oxidoreductase